MKTILLLSVTILSTIAIAAEGDKLLSYQENYPKSPHWYEFTIESYCKDDQEPISVQEFTSEKRYQGKSVRTMHIYADANNTNCKDVVTAQTIKKIVIPADPKRMTHVYVTYSSRLKMKSGH